jgi:hypothetical protein
MTGVEAQWSDAEPGSEGVGGPGPSRQGIGACMEKAEELLEVLAQEALELKHFERARLLELLPRKEALTRELLAQVQALKQQAEELKVPIAGLYQALKGRLDEIVRLNRSNAVFIEGTLAYYNDLMSCMVPTSYTRSQGIGPPFKVVVKGLSVSREV